LKESARKTEKTGSRKAEGEAVRQEPRRGRKQEEGERLRSSTRSKAKGKQGRGVTCSKVKTKRRQPRRLKAKRRQGD
jgi:hypothetical protein